jgi:hypothetical protein
MAYFSKADTETRIVGGSERHTADAEEITMGLREGPKGDPRARVN